MEDYEIVIIPDIYGGGFIVEGRWDGARVWADEVGSLAGQTIEDLDGEDGWWVYAPSEKDLEGVLRDLEFEGYHVSDRT